ncbi:hypothetical protein, partial [Pseudoalteromonas undina]
KFEAQTLLHRHNHFVSQVIANLDALDETAWQQHKQALATHIAEKDKKLRLRSQRIWLAIGNKDINFHMQKRLLE